MAADDDSEEGRVLPFPGSGDPSYVPPPIPSIADTLPPLPPLEDLPESAEETAPEIPPPIPVPHPMSPREALHASEGITEEGAAESADEEVAETGEYGPRPGLMERLGDWIDYRIRLGDARHEAEAPLREAEIAGKVARLQARTAQQTALMEHNGKLRQARLKAQGDRAAAKGKADADRIAAGAKAAGAGKGPAKATGMGADKGHHKPKPGDPGKAPADRRKAQEMAAAAKANDKARRDAEKAREDRRRAADQRKADKQADKAARQRDGGRLGQWAKAREDRRAAKDAAKAADHKAARKSDDKAADHRRKEEAAQAAHLRREAEKDADYRRKQDAADADLKREKKRLNLHKEDLDETKGDGEKDAPDSDPKKGPDGESAGDPEKGPDGASDAADGESKGNDPEVGSDGAEDPADGPESTEDAKRGEESAEEAKTADERAEDKSDAGPDVDPDSGASPGPIPAEEVGITVERADRPGSSQARDDAEPAAVAAGPRGLPPAPEPHTQRPGTTRAEKAEKTEEQVSRPSGRGGGQPRMAAQHQASITVFEYVDNMSASDLQARQDRDVAERLDDALRKIARELRVWAADLAQDDNIEVEVTDKVVSLADGSADMAVVMARFAQGCKAAAEYAFTAHRWVDEVYGEDVDAMRAGGLTQASAASHH